MWKLRAVYAWVSHQITCHNKWFVTHITGMWTFTAIYACWCVIILPLAQWHFYIYHSHMGTQNYICVMYYHRIVLTEWLATCAIGIWMLTLSHEMTPLSNLLHISQAHGCSPILYKDVPSHNSSNWMFPPQNRCIGTHRYVCVHGPSDDPSEWMICYTHCKYMVAHHYVCADVLTEYSSVWMTYYTHHRHMVAHHYERADVPSHDSSDWKICYTRHRYTDARHYVCVDVPSEHSYAWMIYYTHHKHMDVHYYVCGHDSSKYSCQWKTYYKYHTQMDAHQYVCADVPTDNSSY
jgi:hypothetical protein